MVMMVAVSRFSTSTSLEGSSFVIVFSVEWVCVYLWRSDKESENEERRNRIIRAERDFYELVACLLMAALP